MNHKLLRDVPGETMCMYFVLGILSIAEPLMPPVRVVWQKIQFH
jgi:hypothetical protein